MLRHLAMTNARDNALYALMSQTKDADYGTIDPYLLKTLDLSENVDL